MRMKKSIINPPETALLHDWVSSVKKPLRSAALLATLSVVAMLLQMWSLSIIANAFLAKQPLTHWHVVVFLTGWLCRVGFLEIKQQRCVDASLRLRQSIRQQLLQKLLVAGPLRAHYGGDGELTTLIFEKVDALDGYISRYWPQQILVVVTPLLIAIVVSYYSLLSACIMLLTAPLVVVFMILVGKEASQASSQQLQHLAKMGGRFYDFLLGLRTLKQFDALKNATLQLDDAAEQFKTSSFQVLRMAFLSSAVLELFSSLAIALVALYLGLGLIGELPWQRAVVAVDYQPALFILLLAPEFYAPLRQLGADYHAKALAIAAAKDLALLWHAPSAPVIAGTQQFCWQQHHSICLNNVRVARAKPTTASALKRDPQRQASAHAPVPARLEIPTLTIRAGEHWLITGESGSGKTTFLQLLAGFWRWQGQIIVAGHDFADIRLDDWRQQIGYLHQKPEFLPGTVASNLRLARADASEQQMWQVLTMVGLAAFVQAQPLGLAHPLIDNAGNLSGGQQQRLALARLLLADKPIWLFDEPWVHLDPDSAHALVHLIAELARNKTLVIASHQPELLNFMPHRLQLTAPAAALTPSLVGFSDV